MKKPELVCQNLHHLPPSTGWRALLRRVWEIMRAVLRGYTTAQPIDEARPRKGCC